MRPSWARALLVVAVSGCAGNGWRADTVFFADPARVSAALGDPPSNATEAIAEVPALPQPHHQRNCCAFGMDLRVDLAGVEVPLLDIGNVLGVDEIAHHSFTLPDGVLDAESNGLIYTCRGGWIDTAHVREQADNVVFLALAMLGALESGSTIVIPGHGAPTTIVVTALPPGFIEREGRMNIAMTLAAWTAFRISIWHEVSTWFGYQSVAGFSEQPSAFSPEDLYSNALGLRLGMAVLVDHDFRSEADYDVAIEAFIEEALRRLDAQPRLTARAIMGALDGHWWDSTRRLPDNLLVTRRMFPPHGAEISPWRAEDAFERGAVPEVFDATCRRASTRSLVVADHVGRVDTSGVVSIRWTPESWADETLWLAGTTEREVTEHDLDALVVRSHEAMEVVFGRGFDAPR